MSKQAKVPNSLLFPEEYVSAIAIPLISIIKKDPLFQQLWMNSGSCYWWALWACFCFLKQASTCADDKVDLFQNDLTW